jgi:hypothetical protein
VPVDPNWENLFTAIEGQPEIGSRFSNIRRIANGAFSLLFEAQDQQGKTRVALKFRHPFEPVAYRRESLRMAEKENFF